MTTYFGKAPFHAYGNGNTNSIEKAIGYGTFMKTHNLGPHAGGNKPKFS